MATPRTRCRVPPMLHNLTCNFMHECCEKKKGRRYNSIVAAQKWGDGIGKKMHWSFRQVGTCHRHTHTISGHCGSIRGHLILQLHVSQKFYRPHKTWNMQGAQGRGKNCCPLVASPTFSDKWLDIFCHFSSGVSLCHHA